MTVLTVLTRVLVGVLSVMGVAGHAYLVTPTARNVQHNSDYCPQCLNGPEVCGDQRGTHHHEAFGKYASPPKVSRSYAAGGILKARVEISANHMGRWGLGLCALKSASQAAERKTLTKKCFRTLKRADGKGRYVYLPSATSVSTATFKLPSGLKCSRCVIRWVWETGNSCTPPGTPHKYANPNLEVCGTRSAPAGERFTNCADIRIR